MTSSHLRYSGLGDGSPLWNELELVILPNDDDGLVLYNGNANGIDLVNLDILHEWALVNIYVYRKTSLGSGSTARFLKLKNPAELFPQA